MPPEDDRRPDAAKLAAAIRLISAQLDGAAAKQRAEGRVVLRRLNRVEYENTVRDLFAVDVIGEGNAAGGCHLARASTMSARR